MSTSAFSSRLLTLVSTGSRPTNSGSARTSGGLPARPARRPPPDPSPHRKAPRHQKPTPFLPIRLSMIVSRPANAPPQMNRTFVVSIWMNSWCGCLRPPCGGTEAVVPSRILRRACWTPSPLTSRVIEGFFGLAGDLVDLVDVDDPGLGLLDVVVRGLDQLQQDVLDVLADASRPR